MSHGGKENAAGEKIQKYMAAESARAEKTRGKEM